MRMVIREGQPCYCTYQLHSVPASHTKEFQLYPDKLLMPVRDHSCGYTCIGNGCFLKHLAYASQVFKDDYTWQFYSRGQSSLISGGELHDTNLSTFFSYSHFLRVSSYSFAICIFSDQWNKTRSLKPLLCIQDGRPVFTWHLYSGKLI